MIKNIFITGKSSCGNTSLIMEIIKELNFDAGGFFTLEIREGGIRKGFKIITLDGREGILAHINIKSSHRVSKYKVNIRDLEELGVKSILNALKENKICVIDEIGTMEMYSENFKKAVIAALDSKNKVLGTIKLTPSPFADEIKKREDTKVFYLAKENREEIKKEIIKLLEAK